jgi:hypothetical protein
MIRHIRFVGSAVLTSVLALSDLAEYQTPLVYTALARQDFIAGTQNNKFVADAIKAISNANPGFAYAYVSTPS